MDDQTRQCLRELVAAWISTVSWSRQLVPLQTLRLIPYASARVCALLPPTPLGYVQHEALCLFFHNLHQRLLIWSSLTTPNPPSFTASLLIESASQPSTSHHFALTFRTAPPPQAPHPAQADIPEMRRLILSLCQALETTCATMPAPLGESHLRIHVDETPPYDPSRPHPQLKLLMRRAVQIGHVHVTAVVLT